MKRAKRVYLIVVVAFITMALASGTIAVLRRMSDRMQFEDAGKSFEVTTELVARGAQSGFFRWTELYEAAVSNDLYAVSSWLWSIPKELPYIRMAEIVATDDPPAAYRLQGSGTKLYLLFGFSDSDGKRLAPGLAARLTLDAEGILAAVQSSANLRISEDGRPFSYGLAVSGSHLGLRAEDLVAAALLAGSSALLASALLRRNDRFFLQAQGLDTMIFLFENAESYSAHHSRRVASMALELGRRLGLRGKALKDLHAAALLHDIGKIAISRDILVKPGALSPAEMQVMRTHPDASARILLYFNELRHLAPIARAHHEKMDGSGYPDGLAGGEIRFESRILAVADIYEALTGTRPYRQAFSMEEAFETLRSMPLDAEAVRVLGDMIGELHPSVVPLVFIPRA